jgi:trk system potassium uptake protein TrkA
MEFPDIEVVLSDFTDEILIDEQGISNADIALCLTSQQNDNLILSLLAKSVGAKRVLAVVHNDLYMRLQGDLNIDAIVNQKSVVAGAILDIIRKAHIRRLHSFNEGAFELVELTIGPGFKRKGSTIIDLGLPRGILVAFVIHEGLTAIPTGETAIYENDQVGIVLPKEQISRLESLFGA